MIEIPNSNTKSLVQVNGSDVLGNFWSTFNIDLSENKGRIRLGKRMVLNTDTAVTTELAGIPCAIKMYNNNNPLIFTITGQYLLASPLGYPSGISFTRHTNSATTFDERLSDLEVYKNNLYATTATTLEKLTTGTTWSTPSSALSGGTTHMMCVFPYQQLLYITDNTTKIYSWNGSALTTSGTYALDLSSTNGEAITFIKAGNDRIWIGTQNQQGGNGSVYSWDGANATSVKRYVLRSSGALACVVKDDVPYIVDANGDLLAWNGGTFTPLDSFNKSKNSKLYVPLSSTNNRFIHPNGMTVQNNKILIFIDGKLYNNNLATASSQERVPSGVWEWTPETGLIHKHSLQVNKLADTITGYGASRIVTPGALAVVDYPDNTSTRDGQIMLGAKYYTDATTSTYGIFYDNSFDTLQKAGYLVTQQIEASQITEQWAKIYAVYRQFLSSTDKIVMKYRTVEAEPTEFTGTWTSTTTFTTTTNISSYWTSGTGGEVEVLAGVGAGRCSHITSIVNNAGTYTVTVDETYTGATGTFFGRVQSWIKLQPRLTQSQTQDYSEWPISATSTWIQVKMWMLFTGKNEVNKLLLVNKAQQSAT